MKAFFRRIAPLRHLAGPLILVLIIVRIDRRAILDALVHARLWPVFAAGAVVLAAIPLRALRWNALLARMDQVVGFREAFRLYASGTFAGTATPGRVGEMYKAAPLIARGMPARRAIASVLLDRVFDVAVAAAAALLYAVAIMQGSVALAVVAGALAIAAIGFTAFLSRRETALVARVRRAPPSAPVGHIRATIEESLAAIAAPGALARVVLLTAVASACAWLANHLLVRSLGLALDPFETAGVSAAAGLAAMLPVSVLGVGTRDAALLLLLVRYGASPSDAVALSTLFLLLNVWTGLTCGLAAYLPAGGMIHEGRKP